MDFADSPDRDLIAANLKAFAEFMPDMAVTLGSHTPQSKLVKNSSGDWDVDFRGELLYGPDGRAQAERSAEREATMPEWRITMAPLSSRNVDLVASVFLSKMLKRATDAGMSFLHRPETSEAFHLLSFGLGLGYHIPKLLEQVNPISICIVEPNLDFLYHSLAVMDWRPVLERRKNGRHQVTIIIDQDSGAIAKQVRGHMRYACPVVVDWTRTFQAYPSLIMRAAMAELNRDAHLIGIGLGFLHDEMEMIRASYMNLRDGNYRIFRHSNIPVMTPIFVVGSGPSLDDDIEVIKANQHRAVIMACGTSARVLLAHGIKPDFQVLLENGAAPYRALAVVAEEFDFGDAVLIGSNTIDPRVRGLFKDVVYYYRQSLSSYALFSPGAEYSLDDSGPTVTNTGVAAALGMGFREMYLFGVDLGSRNPNRHHSKHSLYRHDGDGKDEQKGMMNFDAVFDIRDVGNFGGLVYTESIMAWTRDTLARVIGRYRLAVEAFNCSDGLVIDNTRPMSSASIRLKSTAEGKAKDLARIKASLPSGTEAHFKERWERENWPQTIADLVGQVQDIIAADGQGVDQLMLDITKLLISERNGLPSVAQFFIRGTIMMMCMCLAFYFRRMQPAERRDEFRAIAMEEFGDILRAITLQGEWFFENIEAFGSDEDLYGQVTEWRYD